MQPLDLDGQSLAVRLAALPADERAEVLEGLTADVCEALVNSWAFEARHAQRPPNGRWFRWLVKGGRGSGKTRTATEWYTDRVEQGSTWLHLLSRTHADVRDTMIQGESGLIAVAHSRNIDCAYESSKRRLWYPDHRAQALIFGAQEPDESRGPQCETAWVDEFSTFPKKVDSVGNTALTNLVFGCRLGSDPRMCVTFTPKSKKEVKAEITRALDAADARVVMTEMSLYDNIANLPDSFIEEVLGTYKGGRLEAQEILGLYLDAVEGALWTPELLDRERVYEHPPLQIIEIGVDPPGETAECGIVIAGVELAESTRRNCFVLADWSIAGPPEVWARRVIDARDYFARAYSMPVASIRIVAEKNQGHDMVRAVIHAIDPDANVKKVTAHEGKRARAEPVALMYDVHRVHHVGDVTDFMELEAEQTTWTPDDPDAESPNRMDALVWVVTDLLGLMNRAVATSQTAAAYRMPELGGRL